MKIRRPMHRMAQVVFGYLPPIEFLGYWVMFSGQSAHPASQPRTCFSQYPLSKDCSIRESFMERRRKRQKACMIYNLFFHWASLCLLRTRLFSPSKIVNWTSRVWISVMCNSLRILAWLEINLTLIILNNIFCKCSYCI